LYRPAYTHGFVHELMTTRLLPALLSIQSHQSLLAQTYPTSSPDRQPTTHSSEICSYTFYSYIRSNYYFNAMHIYSSAPTPYTKRTMTYVLTTNNSSGMPTWTSSLTSFRPASLKTSSHFPFDLSSATPLALGQRPFMGHFGRGARRAQAGVSENDGEYERGRGERRGVNNKERG
jgi:hypothetical protein